MAEEAQPSATGRGTRVPGPTGLSTAHLTELDADPPLNESSLFSKGGWGMGWEALQAVAGGTLSALSFDRSRLSAWEERGKQQAVNLPGGRVDRSQLRGWWQSWKGRQRLGYEFTRLEGNDAVNDHPTCTFKT